MDFIRGRNTPYFPWEFDFKIWFGPVMLPGLSRNKPQTGNTIHWQALFTTSRDLLSTQKNKSCMPWVPMFFQLMTPITFPFCCTTESEENGPSSCCDVYPGRSNNSCSLISSRVIFERCAETPSRGAIGCCSNIPDLKKDILYNLMVMIGQ